MQAILYFSLTEIQERRSINIILGADGNVTQFMVLNCQAIIDDDSINGCLAIGFIRYVYGVLATCEFGCQFDEALFEFNAFINWDS